MCCWVFAIPVVALYTWIATAYFSATGQTGDTALAVEKMLDWSPVLTIFVAAAIGGFGISGVTVLLWFGCSRIWGLLSAVPAGSGVGRGTQEGTKCGDKQE
eukprot:TRINITY_DN62156_c0_g1_i1.p2 TRINITY_DN62156_c0_g1~~TRINITY_DN62156_c0_g1_i1.p2  ORF type:complete len:101 (+),score=17.31 TRINITY_DN62156_c0_g1_i1:246-548(+)